MEKILETVPNFSEGRNMQVVEDIAGCFRGKPGVKLLDYSADKDHNRCVITAVGEPEVLGEAVIQAAGVALSAIDLTRHQGQHPRMGAVDVIPFIPIKGMSIEEADQVANHVAREIAERFGQPSFLYERSARQPHRENLSDIRRGGFEGMAEKMKDPLWQPDYGPKTIHPTGGVTAIGARMPLIAFNINLGTGNLDIAKAIAKAVRGSSGGYKACKALGILLEDRHVAQVSMNMVNYEQTPLYRVCEAIKFEAKRWGVGIIGTEIVGLTPAKALIDAAEYYLRIEKFDCHKQVMEYYLINE